jgi:monofunctional biosynthetic peptidoglycan transglycosylase
MSSATASRHRPAPSRARVLGRHLLRLSLLLLLGGLALQLYFFLRIGLMVWIDPQSTTFERSEAWRLLGERERFAWREQWVAEKQLSPQLKRAVIASEDAGFTEHGGVDWAAIKSAWQRNRQAQAKAERLNQQAERRQVSKEVRSGKSSAVAAAAAASAPKVAAKIVGGSTISQQLAKNLFLSGERTSVRKAQEFLITFMLEGLLDKRRILTLYLNHVEWGEGVFGAQAAAQHYFRVDAAQLSPAQAARLAVMLPAPKRFEKQPGSAYLASRSAVIVARMGAVAVP